MTETGNWYSVLPLYSSAYNHSISWFAFGLFILLLLTLITWLSGAYSWYYSSQKREGYRKKLSTLSYSFGLRPFIFVSMPDTMTSDMPLAHSLSESSVVTMLGIPMPTPGTPTAPDFKGKHVQDFLDSLEQHADSTQVPQSQLPRYVLRYCHTKVRIIIEGSAVWNGDDWVSARNFLADLYSSNDSIPINSPDRLCQWCLKHGESGIVLSWRDVDKYYREFMALSSGLAPSRMLETEISLCYYRGIPTTLRMKIKKRIPATNLKTSSPPAISSLLGDTDENISPVENPIFAILTKIHL